MLTCPAAAGEPGDLDSSCRGVEPGEKPKQPAPLEVSIIVPEPESEPVKKPSKPAETPIKSPPTSPTNKMPNQEKKVRKESGSDFGFDRLPSKQTNAGCLVILLDEAKRMLNQAQKEVALREKKVIELEDKLKEVIETSRKPVVQLVVQSEEERRAAVRRRWRVLVMKVRVGITANVVKKRKVNDPNSFVTKETETVKREDELDLEGACKRKTKVRGKWRRCGFGAGNTQGRDVF